MSTAVEVRSPTGDERLRFDFLAASQAERNRFLAWMEGYFATEQKRAAFVAQWRDAPPPDVRREPPPGPAFGFKVDDHLLWAAMYVAQAWGRRS